MRILRVFHCNKSIKTRSARFAYWILFCMTLIWNESNKIHFTPCNIQTTFIKHAFHVSNHTKICTSTHNIYETSLYTTLYCLYDKIIYSEVLKWDPKWLFCCGHLTIHFMYSKCHFTTLILVVIIQNNNGNDMICCMVNNVTNSSVRIFVWIVA